MVKLEQLIDTTDELMEQLVLAKKPNAKVYQEDGDQLRVKKQYRELRTRVFTILNNNLNGGRAYKLKEGEIV
jgi:hypothetical protein